MLNKPGNYYQGRIDHPWHLSVGAVVLNERNEVCCHYFKAIKHKSWEETFKDFYTLMRETIEMGETIEQTLHRGLMEEFGIEGIIRAYVGSINCMFPLKDKQIEKTTLYFLVDLQSFDPTKRSQADQESQSEIQWQSLDFLIPKMKESAKRLKRADADESDILERVKEYLKS